MFSLMGNCVSCIKRRKEPKKPITLAILGLDCAGKTTTAKGLIGDPLPLNIAPTVGFCSEKFTFERFDITLFDLGGGKKIRGIWKNYFAEVYGVIYVIDSTAVDRMEEAQNNFRELLEHPQVSGKPVLLLANKQDMQDALEEVDICEQLNVETIVNINKCPCIIETVSAIKGTGRKLDANIKCGLKWLCAVISRRFDALKERIEQDIAVEEEKRKIEKAAKAERVRKVKEEREKEEAKERERLGIKKEESEEEDVIDGDPFKTLDVKELEKKEQQLKEQKKVKKEQLKKLKEEEQQTIQSKDDDLDFLRTPRSARNFGPLSDPLTLRHTALDISDVDHSTEESVTPRSSRLLPPLQQPLGTKFVLDESGVKKKKKKKKHRVVQEIDTNEENQENEENVLQQTVQSMSNIEMTTSSLREMPNLRLVNESQQVSSQSNKYYTTEDVVDSAASPRDKQTRKDRHVDNNGYALQDLSSSIKMETEESLNSSVLENSDIVNTTEVRKLKKKKVKRNQVMQSDDDTPFSRKWNFVEDLPEVEYTKPRRPNVDEDDVVL